MRRTPSIAPKYLGLTDKSLIADAPNWKIDLIVDKEDKTLTITDNGIGMNEEDLDKNLGVIANSGTKAFAQALEGEAASQYPGVDRAVRRGLLRRVHGRRIGHRDHAQTRRRAEGGQVDIDRHRQLYTLEEAARDKPGTTIVLKLREGMEEF